MISRKLVAIGFALQMMAVAPAMAKGTSGADKNAHHYSGGPKTEVPHAMKHPKAKKRTLPERDDRSRSRSELFVGMRMWFSRAKSIYTSARGRCASTSG